MMASRRRTILAQHVIAQRSSRPAAAVAAAGATGGTRTQEEAEAELHRAEVEYREQGWTCVRGLLDTAVTGRVRGILAAWAEREIDSWIEQGLLADPRRDLPFGVRLLECWKAAGEPAYSRSPRRDLASPEMYELLSEPVLANLARRLMGTPDILSHSIFNARPKLPAQPWTDTPWHQVRPLVWLALARGMCVSATLAIHACRCSSHAHA
jgi:hypothetical protein